MLFLFLHNLDDSLPIVTCAYIFTTLIRIRIHINMLTPPVICIIASNYVHSGVEEHISTDFIVI